METVTRFLKYQQYSFTCLKLWQNQENFDLCEIIEILI